MNLVEVLVSGSIVLGSASSSLVIWARTAQAIQDGEALLLQVHQSDAQLLSVQARLQSLAAARRASGDPLPASCPALSQPGGPADAGSDADLADVDLTVSADSSGQIVTVTARLAEDHTRTRVFDLAVYGLCGPAGSPS